MNNKTLFGLVIVVSLVCSAVGAKYLAPILGGDFAGGIQPSQLLTCNMSTNSCTLTGNLNYGVGGTALNNQITALYTATVAYPASAAVSLGPVTAATSTTSTPVSFTASGFAVGDACQVTYNGNGTSTNPFGADGFVTAVSGNNVTATVTFWNGQNAVTSLTVTSTVTGASSTLKATCIHTGV